MIVGGFASDDGPVLRMLLRMLLRVKLRVWSRMWLLLGGLLGMAAIHVMGADGTRSVPAVRGAWILKHLLHDPSPPPPANIPQLSRLAGEPRSGRELQTLHQDAPQCAQCHRKIDPIGFGLENFTAAGLWREVETVYVDSSDAKKFKLSRVNSKLKRCFWQK